MRRESIAMRWTWPNNVDGEVEVYHISKAVWHVSRVGIQISHLNVCVVTNCSDIDPNKVIFIQKRMFRNS